MTAEEKNPYQEGQGCYQISIERDFNNRVRFTQHFGENIHDGQHEKSAESGNHALDDIILF